MLTDLVVFSEGGYGLVSDFIIFNPNKSMNTQKEWENGDRFVNTNKRDSYFGEEGVIIKLDNFGGARVKYDNGCYTDPFLSSLSKLLER